MKKRAAMPGPWSGTAPVLDRRPNPVPGAVFEQAPIGMTLSRLDFRFERVNPAFCRMLGYSEQELIGRTFTDVTHPEDVAKSRELAERFLSGEIDRYEMDKRYVRKDGETVWARITAALIQSAEGPRLLAGIQDMSDRVQADLEVRAAEELYRLLVEGLPASTFLASWAEPGQAFYESPQIEGLLGYTPAELMVPGHWASVIHPDDRERVLAEYRRRRATQECPPLEFRALARDGREVWLHEAASVRRDASGQPQSVHGFLLDVTGRKHAEEVLHTRERQLLEAQRLANLGSWEWDVASDVITASAEMFRVYGTPPRATVRLEDFLRSVHREDRAAVRGTVANARRHGGEFDFEHRILWPDHTVRFLRLRGEAVRDEAGHVVRLFGIEQDVTEQRDKAARLVRHNERLQALYRITSAVNSGASPALVHELALDALRLSLGTDRASVLLFDAAGVMRFVAWSGLSDGYRAAVEGHSPWTKDSVAPAPIVMGDVARDLEPGPIRDAILAEGIRSLAFIPIFLGHLLGKFMLYWNAPREPSADEIEFALTMAGHVGLAADRAFSDRALRESHERLRGLAARLQEAREEERARIAREVHDELGQALTALKLDEAWLGKKLRARHSPLARKTDEMARLTDATIQAVRRISTALRPGVLDELGLVAALEWLARDTTAHTGIRCCFECGFEEAGLGPEASTHVFRLVQEALTNVARHAGARLAEIRLVRDADGMTLVVRDDGCGIGAQELRDARSIGLTGMRERAHLLGGEIVFHTEPGRGTTVSLRFPLS
jgi:PAS domain S-box-containing protein